MSDWETLVLRDAMRVKHGYAFPGAGFGADASRPQVLTPGNFALQGGFQHAKPKSFTGQFPPEFLLEPGCVVVTMTDLSRAGDTLGFAARLPEGGLYLHNQRIGLVELTDPERFDLDYFHYLTRTDPYRRHILGTASGSTVKHTSPGRITDFAAPVPSLPEQQAIAEVLGALDHKIAANLALADAADDLMHCTFLQAPSAVTAPLSSTAAFVNGRAFTKDASGTGRVVVRIAELNSGVSGSTVISDAVVDDKHVAYPGDILFAWSGSLTLHRWFRDEAIVNQHIFKVIPGIEHPSWLVYELLRRKLDDFRSIAADKATTMGHIQRHHLDELVVLPSAETVHQLEPLMNGLWKAALNAQRESLTLAAMRDALLPQLMSGKLRVRDAEAAASAAGA